MRQELQQSAINAATSQPAVVSASGITFGVGISTALSYIPVVIGSMASLASLVLLVMLIRKAYYDTKLEMIQIDELERCNMERGIESTRRADP